MKKIIFLLMIVMVSSTMLQAMDSPIKTYMFSSGGKEAMDIADSQLQHKKIVRGLTKGIKETMDVLHKVQAGRLPYRALNQIDKETGYFYPFIQAIHCGESGLIEKMLQAGADPNYVTIIGRPLENTNRLEIIELLLKYKADPRLCEKSTLVDPLFYYLKRKEEHSISILGQFKFDQMNKEKKDKLTEKALRCIKRLLQAGANANREYNQFVPLQAVLTLTEQNHLSHQKATEMIKVLVAHGAHSEQQGIKNYIVNLHIQFFNTFKFELYDLVCSIDEERQKYQAIRQLLIGHKDPNSPLQLLPRDVLKEIGILVRNGFSFRLEEKQLQNKADEEDISETKENDTQSSELSLDASQNSQANAIEIEDVSLPERDFPSTPKKMKALDKVRDMICNVKTKIFMRYNSKLIFALVASGITYWVYEKWKNNKEESERDTKMPRHLLPRHPKKIVRY